MWWPLAGSGARRYEFLMMNKTTTAAAQAAAAEKLKSIDRTVIRGLVYKMRRKRTAERERESEGEIKDYSEYNDKVDRDAYES